MAELKLKDNCFIPGMVRLRANLNSILKFVYYMDCHAAADQRREADRKEQERRQNQRSSVDFVRATLLTSQKGAYYILIALLTDFMLVSKLMTP